MCQKLSLKLYISGNTLRSRNAIANLQKFCKQQSLEDSIIEIIDTIEFPEIAEAEKILITPTLVRELPLPKERIIGDLSDTKVLALAFNFSLHSAKYKNRKT